MLWSLVVVGGTLFAGLLVAALGTRLPVGHSAKVSRMVHAPPDAVWKVITDVEAFPLWRSGVREAARLDDQDGLPAWIESGRSGSMTFQVVSWEPPRRMVTRIADEGLPFGGTWTYLLESAAPHGTRVTITEDGEIYNPLFRFIARFIIGYDGTLRAYLDGLERDLADSHEP